MEKTRPLPKVIWWAIKSRGTLNFDACLKAEETGFFRQNSVRITSLTVVTLTEATVWLRLVNLCYINLD